MPPRPPQKQSRDASPPKKTFHCKVRNVQLETFRNLEHQKTSHPFRRPVLDQDTPLCTLFRQSSFIPRLPAERLALHTNDRGQILFRKTSNGKMG
jgi:hypothetical protein